MSGNPFLDSPVWSLGMACAWIMHRDPDRSFQAANGFFGDIEIDEDLTTTSDFVRARVALVDSLILGKVSSTGLPGSRTRRPIESAEWVDAELTFELTNEGLHYRIQTAGGETLTDIRLLRDEMRSHWTQVHQELPAPPTTMARRRGPVPAIRAKIVEAMRSFPDKAVLEEMTEDALTAQFGHSRETNRLARNIVLSELEAERNSDK